MIMSSKTLFLIGACLLSSEAFRPFHMTSRKTAFNMALSADNDSPSFSKTVTATPASKYPTARGSEVDSRKIIAVAGGEYLTAVRVNHILFASKDMALATLQQLRSASLNFEELASQLSNCDATRQEGGAVGWVAMHEGQSGVNEHLDLVLPKEARVEVLELSTKVSFRLVVVGWFCVGLFQYFLAYSSCTWIKLLEYYIHHSALRFTRSLTTLSTHYTHYSPVTLAWWNPTEVFIWYKSWTS